MSDRVEVQASESGALELPGGPDQKVVVRRVQREGLESAAQTQVRPGQLASGELGLRSDIQGSSVSRAATGDRGMPAVAFDGTNYLVVWSDWRSGSSDIYAARVSTAGSMLDTADIAVSTAAGVQEWPEVAFDGTNYLVVWEDYRGENYDIYGARVSVDGVVLDQAGIGISTATNDQLKPSIAFDGTNCLVVWEDYRSGNYDIYGARVSGGGSVLDIAGIAISTGTDYETSPATAFDGTNYLVVWSESYIAGPEVHNSIYGARVSVGGSVLDTAGIVMSGGPGSQFVPAIAFDGTNYLVVYEGGGPPFDPYEIFGGRVSVEGSLLDPEGRAISYNPSYDPAIAFDGTNYLVVWTDYGSGSSRDIYGGRVNTSGNVLYPVMAVCTAAGDQQRPAIAFDGTNYLVVWEDYRSGTVVDIYATRVTTSGTVLDPEGLTGLIFASASAVAAGDYVILTWTMGVEVSASSFLVQRSNSREGEYSLVDVTVLEAPRRSFSCVDYAVVPGRTYWYRIALSSHMGDVVYGPISVYVSPVPIAYLIRQNYPNPFNPLCTIRYEIPQAGRVTLRVFDIAGSPVRTLVDAWREPGTYSQVWDGRADDARALPSGVYFYRLEAGDFVATRKMVLLR